jgi:hypothetical protein
MPPERAHRAVAQLSGCTGREPLLYLCFKNHGLRARFAPVTRRPLDGEGAGDDDMADDKRDLLEVSLSNVPIVNLRQEFRYFRNLFSDVGYRDNLEQHRSPIYTELRRLSDQAGFPHPCRAMLGRTRSHHQLGTDRTAHEVAESRVLRKVSLHRWSARERSHTGRLTRQLHRTPTAALLSSKSLTSSRRGWRR